MNANQHSSPRILLIGGGAGCGKTALATALADTMPGAAVVHLDSFTTATPTWPPASPASTGRAGSSTSATRSPSTTTASRPRSPGTPPLRS
ncbi:zeta toxin family protein [Streptomyces sp. NPDC059382]|uniref:zeta toxin family protein n=1 Tax=Streptomyces sp. NPDC059382 TaxID=3346816 RepID=UPI0036BB686E